MSVRAVERNFKDTIKVKLFTGLNADGTVIYSAETTVSKCRKEDGYFEKIDSKGDEIKSKTQISNFELYIPENSKITEINGVVLAKPLIVKADANTPTIRYDARLYDCWI